MFGSHFDALSLLDQVDGDPVLLREILGVFDTQTTELVETLRGSLARGDTGEVLRAAHTLKGCLMQLGMQRPADVAAQMEQFAREGALRPVEERMDRFIVELHHVRMDVQAAFGP